MVELTSVVFVWGFFAVVLIQVVSGQVKIVQPFPQNIYPIEGESASATCIAEGPHDKVQFVRRNQFGKFSKLVESVRVYTTNRTSGDKTIFTLHFKTVKLEDDSTVERYECWAHKPGDISNQWDDSAKHGFNVQVIRKSSLPTVTPSEAVFKLKEVGQSLVMECNMSIPKKAVDVVPESVHWLKNKVIIETIYAEGGKFKRTLKPLVFDTILASDGGNYTCILETKMKRIKPYNITGGPYIVKIQVHMSEGDREIQADFGGNVTLECSAEGYPLNVVWKKVVRGKETDIAKISGLSEHVRFRQDCPFCHHMMEIFNITEAFEGIYVCRTVNSVGSGHQQFTLKINDTRVSSSVSPTAGTVAVFFVLLLHHIV